MFCQCSICFTSLHCTNLELLHRELERAAVARRLQRGIKHRSLCVIREVSYWTCVRFTTGLMLRYFALARIKFARAL